jgi:arsenite methyltransferase
VGKEQHKENVKKGYAGIVKRHKRKSLLPKFMQCCDHQEVSHTIGLKIGYTEAQLMEAPTDANLGIGCGNPLAFADVTSGETVLDLGSGAGFDCFLASRQVGESGKVIGIDITGEMVAQAKKNALKGNYGNVEFLVGNIEEMPLEANSVDLIISNCVINLSNKKERIFRESFRVLRPNGRILISDIVLLRALPGYLRDSVEGHIACLAGAVTKYDYLFGLVNAGFGDVAIVQQKSFPIELMLHDPIAQKIINDNKMDQKAVKLIADSIVSLSIRARK